MNKLTILALTMIFCLSIVYSSSEGLYLDNYSACLQYNSEKGCDGYFQLTKSVSKIIDLSATKGQNLNQFVNCVQNQKTKNNFDYRDLRNTCYNEQLKVTTGSFKANCFYNFDNNDLVVNCKGIFPTKDYSWDIVLNKTIDNIIQIQPKLILNSNLKLTGTNFDLFVKKIDLSSLGISTESTYSILPLALEVNNPESKLDVLFNSLEYNAPTMDQLYRSYLDCITMKVLLSETKGENFNLKKSGYNFLYTPEKLINSCKDDIGYTFVIAFEQYDTKKNTFFDMVDLLLKNYLSDSNFNTVIMSDQLNTIVKEYYKFAETERIIDQMKDTVLKLSLDTDYFLFNLQRATKNLDAEEKKNVLSSAGPTLLRNKEDTLDIRRKTKLSLILDFFSKDIQNISDESIKQIYSEIAHSLIKKHFEDNNDIDLTDVQATISSQGVSLENYTFDFSNKTLLLSYKGDQNRVFLLNKDENGLTINTGDYNINTVLSVNIENNSLFVSSKEISIIDKKTITEMYRGVSEIKQVDLLIDDSLPVYIVHKEIIGKLLGIIKIKEKIESRYYATTGLVYSTKKPWWDFLVVYN